VGTLRQPVVDAEVIRINVARAPDVGGSRELDLGADRDLPRDPMQWFSPDLADSDGTAAQ
jgi:hypothetical protein